MVTFRSILSQWIFTVAIFCVSFTSLGAAFAPLSPSFSGSLDSMRLSFSMELRIVSGPGETQSPSRRDSVLSRLEERILTHRAISVSA